MNSPQELTDKTVTYPHVSFAVVILSLDQGKNQPTQNTIYTLGYLVGRLGNTNVVAIYPQKQGLEIPDDSNILWIEYKTGWYLKLVKELEAANFEVDSNKLSWL